MPRHVAAHFGGGIAPAFRERPVMVARARLSPVGFGVAQQHQAAHGTALRVYLSDGGSLALPLARTIASRHQGTMTGTDPSRYGPTWYAATAVAAPERPA